MVEIMKINSIIMIFKAFGIIGFYFPFFILYVLNSPWYYYISYIISIFCFVAGLIAVRFEKTGKLNEKP